jgi:hypothetical protein
LALYRAAGRYEGQLKHDSCDAESSIDRGAERAVTAVASLFSTITSTWGPEKQRRKCTYKGGLG